MPRPTVSPIETEMSWRAVWKPERYDSDEDEPDSCCETKVKRPQTIDVDQTATARVCSRRFRGIFDGANLRGRGARHAGRHASSSAP